MISHKTKAILASAALIAAPFLARPAFSQMKGAKLMEEKLLSRERAADSLLIRANSYNIKGKYSAAYENANKVLQSNPKNFDALGVAGYSLAKMERFDEAEKTYEKMIGAATTNGDKMMASKLSEICKNEHEEVSQKTYTLGKYLAGFAIVSTLVPGTIGIFAGWFKPEVSTGVKVK